MEVCPFPCYQNGGSGFGEDFISCVLGLACFVGRGAGSFLCLQMMCAFCITQVLLILL